MEGTESGFLFFTPSHYLYQVMNKICTPASLHAISYLSIRLSPQDGKWLCQLTSRRLLQLFSDVLLVGMTSAMI